MNPPRVIIFVPGIMHDVEATGWCDRAVMWTSTHTDLIADKMEYASSWWGRRFVLGRLSKDLAQWCLTYAAHDGAEIELCGHSNGTEVIVRAVRELQQASRRIRLARIHLIAGAADESFERNGLNLALSLDVVGTVHIYNCATPDKVLKLGRWSRRLFGWLGLGYGALGLNGPQHVAPDVAMRVFTTTVADRTHTNWFDADRFETTIKMVITP